MRRGRRRPSGWLPLGWGLLLVMALGGCAAGAPSAGAPRTPTSTPAQMAAVQATAVPSPTVVATVPPATATATPAVKVVIGAAPTASDASGAGVASAVAGGTEGGAQPTPRPAVPADPGGGISEIVPNPETLESPRFDDQKEVALTFDAGADRGNAEAILDLLRDDGIKGSFGMTGLWAQANPDLVKRMVAEGHMLINHTWDHDSLTGANTGKEPMSEEKVARELGDTEALVRELTGYEMKPYFRPPYGDYGPTSLGYVAANGYYITVWWTCDTHGWDGWDAAKITGYCTTNIKPHEILLLHVGAGAGGDLAALPEMIDFFRGEGYRFVTVDQMVKD